jgi:phosphatidylserine/phosphatidylglycerophosphate/cardiolipin synthase-like enzyme
MSALPAIARGSGAAGVHLVPDDSYLAAVQQLMRSARHRLLCSVFIVDLTPTDGGQFVVDDLLLLMAEASWRGADVRLLVGGSRDNIALAQTADAARARAQSLGLPCLWLSSRPVRGSHCKIVVADDALLTGSHNWSPGALAGAHQIQDSLCVWSPAVAQMAAHRFQRQWARAGGEHVAL